MTKSIKSILSKKKLTGKEVGRALLLSLKHDIENKGNPNKKPLFSQADFNRMVDSLDTDTQYAQYKVFETIYSSLVDSFNYTEALGQQFYNGYYRYFLAIREAQRAEDFFTTMEKFPLILTQAQYDKMAEESIACNREEKESFHSLFFHAVSFFVNNMEEGKADDIPENIKDAILITHNQKVTNPRVLVNWNEDMGRGYYTLPDGQRSDNVSSDEWQEALASLFAKSYKFYEDGIAEDDETTIMHFNERRLLAAYRLLFKGEDAMRTAYKEHSGKDLPENHTELLEKALEDIIDGKATANRGATQEERLAAELFYGNEAGRPKWHYYTEPPEDLTRYDVLVHNLDRYMGNYKNSLLEAGGEYTEEIPKRTQFKEFKNDYPELTEAITNYIKDKIPAASISKISQLYKRFITRGELADIGFMDFQKLIDVKDTDIIERIAQTQEDNTENFNRRLRGLYHGIAILKNPNSADTGDGKEYIDPVTDKINTELLQGIDYLENNQEEAEYIQNNLDVLALPALRFIYAYNTLIHIISLVYDIDFIQVAKYNLTRQEKQIEACNNILYMLYKRVYGTPEDKKRKRNFIRKCFRPIEVEDLKPRQEDIMALLDKLDKLGYSKEAVFALKNYRSLIAEIMRKGDAE